MKLLNHLLLIFLILTFAGFSFAQKDEILATANGQNYTVKDLDPATREEYEGLQKAIKQERTELLGDQIATILLKDEAVLRKLTVDKLLEIEVSKRIIAPTDTEIKVVYDANKEQIGGRSLEEVKPQIVNFLQRESYGKALSKYVSELKAKYKVIIGKDVNAANLLAADVLATVNNKPITVKTYNEKAGPTLYDLKMSVYERAYNYLETTIFTEMTGIEAKKADLSSSDLIAREIANKMKDYTDEEREKLENDFRQSLIKKYSIKILLKEPEPFVQKISVDDDPSQGSATAPVTIVMFSDFQCPACSATHPILKKVMAQYPNKIRFVVRDFPLIQIHQNAFLAAQAAGAANAQGKFFEYIELLYNNQNSLDKDNLKRFAAETGLNVKQFETDLESGKFAAEVKKDMADGDEYGVGSTPTIFVNGVKVRNLSVKDFKQAIERALKK
jgi:protein-disulfide isomerase